MSGPDGRRDGGRAGGAAAGGAAARPRRRRAGTGRRRALVARVGGLALVLAAAGCGGLEARLDVPPGQRVVLGGVDLTRLDDLGGLLEIIREDGEVRLDLPLQRGQRSFITTLPPGRYRIVRFRVTDTPQLGHLGRAYELRATLEVGDAAAIYVGTLRLVRDRFTGLRLEVDDEYERTVSALRGRYPDLPAVVARALVRPA